MVEREIKSFFNVELVQRDVGNWSYLLNDHLKEVVTAYNVSLGLERAKKSGGDEVTLEGAVDKALEKVREINMRLTSIKTINMSTDVRTKEDCRTQLHYFSVIAQKRFFKCPPFNSLLCTCNKRRADHYRRNMLDGLWFLKAADIKVEIKEDYAPEGTLARAMVTLNNSYDPKIMVGPLLREGDRFNMMLCFATMADAIFGTVAVARSKSNKRLHQEEIEDGDDSDSEDDKEDEEAE